MRSALLCTLTLLWGAEIASAQQTPSYPYPPGGYAPGYAPIYPMPPRYPVYSGYAQPGPYGYYPNPGYNYPRIYPVNSTSNNSLYYPQYLAAAPSAPVPAAPTATAPTATAPTATAPPHADLPAALPATPTADDPGHCAAPTVLAGPAMQVHQRTDETFWINADYALGWIRPQHLTTPLLTTGSTSDAIPGAIGQPGTAILFGDKITYKAFSGLHLEAGLFLDKEDLFSIDGGGFYLFPNRTHFAANSDDQGNPLTARPIFNTGSVTAMGIFPQLDPGENSEPVAFPASARLGTAAVNTGGTTIDSQSELRGFEINGRFHIYAMDRLHADVLAGARTLYLRESLTIQDLLVPLASNPDFLSFLGFPPALGGVVPSGQVVNFPNSLTDIDSFQTSNSFYGMQVGGRLRWEEDWFFVSVFGKVALGETQQKVSINGATTFITPGGNYVTSGGVLALPSNIGTYHRNIFGIVPETGLTVGADITKWLRLTAGYSFLYWSQVARPGNQIDRNVNKGQVPSDFVFGVTTGPAAPIFHFNEEAFWLNNFNFGVELRY
jgi:Putative beta barrel porin-7 (BBP7)